VPISWTLELKDEMSGPARNIVINLNQVSESTNRVIKETKESSKVSRDAAREMREQAKEQAKQAKEAARLQRDEARQARASTRDQARSEAKTGRELARAAKEQARQAREESRRQANEAKKAATDAKKAADDAKKARDETGKAVSSVAVAIGTGIERAAEKILEVGRELFSSVLEVNRVATATKIAFEVMTGSAGQAEASFEEMKRVAYALGAPLEQVAASYKEMLSSGESVTNLQLITKAASDLSHTEGGDIETWTKAFSEIRGKGELAGRSLASFVGAVDFDVLARKLGLTTHGYKELTKTLSEKPVSAQKGIQAILQTIAEGEGGSLETVSRKMRDTFSGTVATIKDQLLQLFEFDSEGSPILEFMHGVRDALDPDGPLVLKIKEGAAAFMEGLGLLTPGDGKSGMAGLIQSLKDGTILGDDFKTKMKEVGEDVRAVAEAIGIVAKGVIAVSKALASIKGGGYRDLEAAGAVRQATAEEMARAVPTTSLSPRERYGGVVKAALHGVFGDSVGDATSSVPKMASGGRVTSPTLALIGEGGEPESVIPDSKLGGLGGARLHLEQHFHIEGGGGVDIQELARHLHAISLTDLQGALDTMGQSMGAT
jgi:hypothetical protein